MVNEKLVQTLDKIIPYCSTSETEYAYIHSVDFERYEIQPQPDGKYLITSETGERWMGWHDPEGGAFHLESNGFEWVYNEETKAYVAYDQSNGQCIDPSYAEFADAFSRCDSDSQSCPQDPSVNSNARLFADTTADQTTPTETESIVAPKEEDSGTADRTTSSSPKGVSIIPEETPPASRTAEPAVTPGAQPSAPLSVTQSADSLLAVQSPAQPTVSVTNQDNSGTTHTTSAIVVSPESAQDDQSAAPAEGVILGAALLNSDGSEAFSYPVSEGEYCTIAGAEGVPVIGYVIASLGEAEIEKRAASDLPETTLAGEEESGAAVESFHKEVAMHAAALQDDAAAPEAIRVHAGSQNPFDVEQIFAECGEGSRFVGWPIPLTTLEFTPMSFAVTSSHNRDTEAPRVARNGDPRDQNGNSGKGGQPDQQEEHHQQSAQEEAQA